MLCESNCIVVYLDIPILTELRRAEEDMESPVQTGEELSDIRKVKFRYARCC